MTFDLRRAVLAHAQRPWAIMPSTLAVVASAVREHPNATAASVGTIELARPEARRLSARSGQERKSGDAVAVIPLRGVITPRPSLFSLLFGGGGGLAQFQEDFRSALGDDEVGSILIDVDSPGGLVDLVPEMAAEIRGARGRKPIVAIANTRAASAAYWLAAQADELVVTPSGEVGSIGVYMAHEDWSGWYANEGIATTFISAGKFKTEGNDTEALSKDAAKHLQALVDESYEMFTSDVAEGRGVDVKEVRNGYGEGRVLTPSMALDAGMVDSVETFEQVVARMVNGGGRVKQEEESEEELEVEDDDEDVALMLGASTAQSQSTWIHSSANTTAVAGPSEPVDDDLPSWAVLDLQPHT